MLLRAFRKIAGFHAIKLTPIMLISAALASCGGGSGGGNSSSSNPVGDKLLVVVVAIDSLMPEEIDFSMVNLQSLMASGTSYTESRAVFSGETIPNHVAMMTGVYPDRSGIPTNNFWDKDAKPNTAEEEELDNPNELEAKTLFTWIKEKCDPGQTALNIRTAAVMSKDYLYEIFRGDAVDGSNNDANGGELNLGPDEHWNPQDHPAFIPSPGGLTPDEVTGPAAVERLANADFMFINLGNVDRAAHAVGEIIRPVVKATADQQIGALINEIQSQGRWERTVFIVTSDHGMDYSLPLLLGEVSTSSMLEGLGNNPACDAEPMFAVQNGGTNSIYVANAEASLSDRIRSTRAARACILNFDGNRSDMPSCEEATSSSCLASLSAVANADQIENAWYADPEYYEGVNLKGVAAADAGGRMPASIKSRHQNLGDLVLSLKPGYRFSEPSLSGNPIPGNHGHITTLHTTLVVSGGVDFLRAGQTVDSGSDDHMVRSSAQGENIDIAATVAWLFGLDIDDTDFPDAARSKPNYGDGASREGFDGRVLSEAFTVSASPSQCGILF